MSKKIEIRAEQGDVIGVGVDGNGNIIAKEINLVINQARGYGLTLIPPNHFKENSNTDSNFEDWKNGFDLSLESIYYNRDYRRENVLQDIENKLESQKNLLLLGESGFSKSILLRETICHYFDLHYKILHSEGDEELKEPENIAQFIRDLVIGGNKVLLAIDNVHDKKMATIFYIIKLLESFNKRDKILCLLSARQPEYSILLEKGKFTLKDNYRHAFESLFVKTPDYNYEIKRFSETEIIGFITKFQEYLPQNRKQKSVEQNAKEIFEDTEGHPIMVKFSVIREGLQRDVEDKYGRYLVIDRDGENPDSNRIRTVIICSLFHISTLQITEELLKKVELYQYAIDLDRAILYSSKDRTWRTIHPRWDLELISYLFRFSNRNLISIIKDDLEYTLQSMFKHFDEQIFFTIVYTLYSTIAFNNYVSIDIINSVIESVSNNLGNDDKLILYTFLAMTHFEWGKYEETIELCTKALTIDPDFPDPLYYKVASLSWVGKYREAFEEYYRLMKIEPDSRGALYIKTDFLERSGKHQEAIEEYDKILNIDQENARALTGKRVAFRTLGRYEDALLMDDEKLRKNPDDLDVLYEKTGDLHDLMRYEEEMEVFDKIEKIDPDFFVALYMKGTALRSQGRHEEELEVYDKILKRYPMMRHSKTI